MMRADEALAAMRSLPYGDLKQILQGGTPIVLAPHPDDEVLGCGALLIAAAKAGPTPLVVFVTDGSGSHPASAKFPREALAAQRKKEAFGAAELMGLGNDRLHFLGIPDTQAPREGGGFNLAVDAILALIDLNATPVLLATWEHDPHGDHQAVHRIAKAVAARLGCRHLSYPVWGWTLPAETQVGDSKIEGWRFRIEAVRDQKMRALYAHASQCTDLIDDDPTGFRLNGAMIDAMTSGDEIFLVNS